MKKKIGAIGLFITLCALLGGCGGFAEPLAYLPVPWAGQEAEADAWLLLGPGPDEGSLAGAEWGIFESMRQPGHQAAPDENPQPITVYVPVRTDIFSQASEEAQTGETLAGGTFIKVTGNGPLWFACEGRWLYGQDLFPVEDGRPTETSLTATLIEGRFAVLEEKLPEGSYWNHMGQELPEGVETPFSVTKTPCEHSSYGQAYCNFYSGSMLGLFSQYGHLCQCLGFASLLSDRLFGEAAPLYLLPHGIRPQAGDHLRLLEYEHSLIVREADENGLRLAEANPEYEDCLISWQRTFTWEEWEALYGWDVEYTVTRYPFYQEEGRWVALEAIPAYTPEPGVNGAESP